MELIAVFMILKLKMIAKVSFLMIDFERPKKGNERGRGEKIHV